MVEPHPDQDAPAWAVRVRGTLGVCSGHYEAFHPRFDGECTALEAPSTPGRSLVSLLLDLQALGLEVVEIERRGT